MTWLQSCAFACAVAGTMTADPACAQVKVESRVRISRRQFSQRENLMASRQRHGGRDRRQGPSWLRLPDHTRKAMMCKINRHEECVLASWPKEWPPEL